VWPRAEAILLAAATERLPGLFSWCGYGLAKLADARPRKRRARVRIVGPGQSFGAATALLGRDSRYEARRG
jgi:hypothetical protein